MNLPAADFDQNLSRRRRSGRIWRLIFQVSTIVGIVVLTALLYNILNQSFGLAAVEYAMPPESVAGEGGPLEELSGEALQVILGANASAGLVRALESEKPLAERSRDELYELVMDRVAEPQVVKTWSLVDSLLQRRALEREAAEKYPAARLQSFSWINRSFIERPQAADPLRAGVRTALLGSLWTVGITVLFAFPVGVGAAIYLEEYAGDSRLNRLIQTNINNLAGVPSIIYGMLGLAIFVRALEPLTSGALLGYVEDPTQANGRTILSAGLTLAPLVVVGASTYITFDPDGPFSKFTALPIQIYQWTARPQAEFRNLAAAAILVLLALLLAMNVSAILLRNRYRRQY